MKYIYIHFIDLVVTYSLWSQKCINSTRSYATSSMTYSHTGYIMKYFNGHIDDDDDSLSRNLSENIVDLEEAYLLRDHWLYSQSL